MKPHVGAVRALLAIASGIWASSASADGYQPLAGYAAPIFVSWTGIYVGGHIGGAWSDSTWANVDFTGEPGNMTTIGFLGGVHLGYNYQFNKMLLGVEATYSGTTLNDGFISVVDPNVTYKNNVNDIITVTGRLGVALDRWLMYAKGGWASAQVVVSGLDATTTDSFSLSDRRNGWTVGGGLEYKVAHNISFGVEYGYIDLGSKTYNGTTALALPVTVTSDAIHMQTATARLSFHFNHGE
jgi:outer membrane immunogenic protein